VLVDKNNGSDHKADVLLKWKRDHETRIKQLLDSGYVPLLLKPQKPLLESIGFPPKLADKIYSGSPGDWSSIVDAYKNETGCDLVTPPERLALLASYDIGRVRKLADYKDELTFVDSSWLAHGYAFWQVNQDMARWLHELGKIASDRATRGLRTRRAFYWSPNKITSHEDIEYASQTIVNHLNSGIRVFLIEPEMWSSVMDFQLFTNADGLSSGSFKDFSIDQHFGGSETAELVTRACRLDKSENLPGVIYFGLDSKINEIRPKLVERCPNMGNGSTHNDGLNIHTQPIIK
jgi:hypothetical protein